MDTLLEAQQQVLKWTPMEVLKIGDCCDFSAEEAFEKIYFSWKSALCVMVSNSGNKGFLLLCFNSAFKYLVVAIIMLVVVAVGMMILWGNQETVCPIQTELVIGIKFDGKNIVQDWGQFITQTEHVETMSLNLRGIHE